MESLDSAMNDESNKDKLFILDFSKTECPEWKEDFYFSYENTKIQGVILPDSIQGVSYFDCPDLKFVQFNDSQKRFFSCPFYSYSLRYIFITGNNESIHEYFNSSPILHYNSAKIIYQDCFEYAKSNNINLYKLNAAVNEKNFKLFVPPEEVKVTNEVTINNQIYSTITTDEESDRRVFHVEFIKLNEKTGLSEDELQNYETVINKMNEFISWNCANFYNRIILNWKPRTARGYFTSSLGKIITYKNYISIICYFSYDTGFPHETHEYKSFCYDTKTKRFVNLSEASGWSLKELHDIILNADFDDGFNISKENQDLDIDIIENLNFEFLEDGKIEILFSDYIFDRYSHDLVIERK
ncbi:hypothetical protein [Treponema sp.]|uniref:hypothetical protein n=1 Tax=Treponema sp. TaxID=166 RepID=UPI00388CFADE